MCVIWFEFWHCILIDKVGLVLSFVSSSILFWALYCFCSLALNEWMKVQFPKKKKKKEKKKKRKRKNGFVFWCVWMCFCWCLCKILRLNWVLSEEREMDLSFVFLSKFQPFFSNEIFWSCFFLLLFVCLFLFQIFCFFVLFCFLFFFFVFNVLGGERHQRRAKTHICPYF